MRSVRDGSDKRIVSQHRPGEPKWLGGWSPEGKRIVYLEWGEGGRRDRILVRYTGYRSIERGDGGGRYPVPQCWRIQRRQLLARTDSSILFVGE